ncbi:MAG: hypothetical protein ACLQQ4_17755 [Bacteroidia bacterium]
MKKNILLAVAVLATFTMKAGDLTGTTLFSDNSTSNLNTASYHGGGGGGGGNFFGISIGAALPQSAYGAKAKNTSNDSTVIPDGFANTGFHFDLTGGHMFSDNIGVMVMLGGNLNSYDVTTYESVYSISSPATFTSSSYFIGQFLVGPVLSFGDKLKFNVRALIGYVMATGITQTETNGQSGALSTSETVTGNMGGGFGYNIGAGIKYGLSGNMGLLFNVDYLGSSVGYTGYKESWSPSIGNGSTTNTTLKQTMSLGMINISIGLAWTM